jgi:hypothetical protein
MTDGTETPQTGDQGSASSIADTYKKLDLQDRIVLIGTAGAFLIGFLPWYTMSGLGTMHNGFAFWSGKIYFLACLAIVGLLLLPALRQQLLEKLSPGARALTIPILAAATLIFGPVFFMMSTGEVFAGAGNVEGIGRTGWFLLAFLASAAAAGSAGWKWKQSAASS